MPSSIWEGSRAARNPTPPALMPMTGAELAFSVLRMVPSPPIVITVSACMSEISRPSSLPRTAAADLSSTMLASPRDSMTLST